MNPIQMDVDWRGPHGWPKLRLKSPLDDLSGVYLWTVESDQGYVASGCGVTTRTIRQRVTEHRRGYLEGRYTLLDIEASRNGIRKEIWHGMWKGYNTEERKAEFQRRKEELREVAIKQMAAYRIFVAPVSDQRIQERLETAIQLALYDAPKPYCDLPDQGTHMRPRRDDETPIQLTDRSEHRFVNLPKTMMI